MATDALVRLGEMRNNGTPADNLWIGKNFTHRRGEVEYEVDIKIKVKK